MLFCSIFNASGWVYFRFKGNTVTSQEGMPEDAVLSSEQQHTAHLGQRAESEDRRPLSTGEYTLDQALEIHLSICVALLRVSKQNLPFISYKYTWNQYLQYLFKCLVATWEGSGCGCSPSVTAHHRVNGQCTLGCFFLSFILFSTSTARLTLKWS